MATSLISKNDCQVDWQNPRIFGINKLPPRYSAWPCPDASSAWQSHYDSSPWVQSLNGKWHFHWVPHPDQRPEDFHQPAFDASKWNTIQVPSCWELEGFKIEPAGQPNYGVPIYSNYTYPHAATTSGRVMDTPPVEFTSYNQRNPVGSYRTTFKVPHTWNTGRTIIHFAGVYSAMYIWVNGHKVGFSQDSRSPAEFDVTDFIQPGDNLLAVEVYRWCSGSYLEDQDMWRMSGIYRDVFLYHTPDVSIWDAYFHYDLNADMNKAIASLFFTLRSHLNQPPKNARLHLSLRDPSGALIGNGYLVDHAVNRLAPGFNPEIQTASVEIDHPQLWTHETPHLYRALIELVVNDTVIEARMMEVGFRQVSIIDNQYCLNGKPVKIRGVNRHESSPTSGYTLTRALMERDLTLIKQNNINFTRCSHYPNDPRWYELCNRWGMLVIDEANVESHGLSYHKKVLPGDDPAWEPAVVDRMYRMVIRDRGNPCVTMWSLGNEAGYGKAFRASRNITHAHDPQKRPIQYADMNMVADVDSQTYPTVDWLKLHLQGKAVRKGEHGEIGVTEQHGPYPSGRGFMTNEYAHAHQNSLGNFQDYWDVFNSHPQLWGGFIWEWADQTLLKRDENGRYFHAYGGDFGDQPNSGRFCIKGLVSADREPRPHYWEAKKVHQYIEVKALDIKHGKIRIKNNYHSLSLDTFSVEWILQEDGMAIQQGTLADLRTAPGESQDIAIPWNSPVWQSSKEYFVTIRFSLKSATRWAGEGYNIAWEQLVIQSSENMPPKVQSSTDQSHVAVTRQGEDLLASVGSSTVRICGKTGLINSIKMNGRERILSPITPDFWRVPIDNDIGWRVPENFGPWRDAIHKSRLQSIQTASTNSGAVITSVLDLPFSDTTLVLTYHLKKTGSLRVDVLLNIGKDAPELSRIGVTFQMPSTYDHIRWFGRGPHENYRDRKSGAAVGLYELKAGDWITHYVRPQENANRTDIRWIELSDAAKMGIRINSCMQLISASIWTCCAEDLDHTPHDYLLPKREYITVNIDGFQMGVGGDTSWGEPVHHEYRIEDKGPHAFAFEISALG